MIKWEERVRRARWLPDWLYYLLVGGYFKDLWLLVTGHGYGGNKQCDRKSCCPDIVTPCGESHGPTMKQVRPLMRHNAHPGWLFMFHRYGTDGEVLYSCVALDLEVLYGEVKSD